MINYQNLQIKNQGGLIEKMSNMSSEKPVKEIKKKKEEKSY